VWISSAQKKLTRAQTALTRREFRDAQDSAEELLRTRIPPDVLAGALLVAGDAAYAMRAYGRAVVRYSEFLSLQATGPDAMHAALQRGWAQLRDGRRDGARLSWMETADRSPADPRAPLGLILAAEIAIQARDTTAATALLDRLIVQFPSSVHAGTARLSRAILALREQREDAAVRDLDELIRVHGTSAVESRRRTMEAFAITGAEAALETLPAGRGVGIAGAVSPSDEPLARFANAFVQSGDRESIPYVLYGLALVGAGNRGWSDGGVVTLVRRLVDGWPSYPAAPALLARVAAAAAAAGQWPIAREASDALIARYPGSAIAATTRVDLAEMLARAGARTEARAYLQEVSAAGGDTALRALLLLAGVEEAMGNRGEALAAYDRVLREHSGDEGAVSSVLSHARLLESSGQPDVARSLLQRIVDASDGDVAAEASYRIARILSAQGQEAAAVEWYMTAAYVAEGSPWERPSLLGATRSFTALNRTHEATIAYRKLTATPAAVGSRDAVPAVAASPALAGEQKDGVSDAAFRLAEALQRAGDHDAALEMYLTAAHQAAGGPAAPRALLGAIRTLVAAGDRLGAEAIYRRLLESDAADPALLAEARKTIRTGSN
jgi:tetratricopeptide (TPR) repeat protein